MKTKFILTLCLPLALAVTSFAASTDEKTVRDADEAWSKAAGAKDLDKTVSYYADDAIVLPPNEPMLTTKEDIRNLWKGFLDSLQNISWSTTRIEVAKAGDMATTTGTYELTMKDGAKDRGKYCEVWKKKADGQWKVVIDMFSSDLTAASVPAAAADKK